MDKLNTEVFIERSLKIHGNKYDYSLVNYINNSTKVKIGLDGIFYEQTPSKHLMGRCPEKNTPKKTTEQFITEAKKIWGDKYDYSLVEYKGALRKIKIVYDGVIFEQIPISHLRGQSPEKNITYDNFIRKSLNKHGNKYDYSLVKFVNIDTPVMIGYKGIFYLQKPYNHMAGYCPENIVLSSRKSLRRFINESNLVHDFKFNYDNVVYEKNNIKVIIVCPIHGKFLQTPNSHLSGHGCPNCNESMGEKEIFKFLKNYKLNVSRQHKFSECRNVFELPFDFYIPILRTCIEFDGPQHYYPIEYFGGLDAFTKLKINDEIKNQYCEDNYINLIRIRYDEIESIWDILWSHLGSAIRRLKLDRGF